MRITREQLYKEIWSEPATKLAQRYDVSSSYLARVCEGLNLPHPPRGYWARKAAGEKMPVPPLPPPVQAIRCPGRRALPLWSGCRGSNCRRRRRSQRARPDRRSAPLITRW